MFLCAVARPRFNPCSNSWWDGKLGIWSIGDWEPAKQKSKNRPKGTLVWKKRLLLRKYIGIYLFPNSFHPSWRKGLEGTYNGINATLYTQAVNSPDANLLDLGFFRAIQSFKDAAPKNKKELIEAVSEAYDKYPHHKINQAWLTLQCCFNQIIMHHGNNNYNIDHIGKEQLEQNGNLPNVMDVVEDVANMCNYNDTDNDDSNNDDIDEEENT